MFYPSTNKHVLIKLLFTRDDITERVRKTNQGRQTTERKKLFLNLTLALNPTRNFVAQFARRPRDRTQKNACNLNEDIISGGFRRGRAGFAPPLFSDAVVHGTPDM